MLLTYFLFVVGFVILIKGAGWLVDGSSSIAKRFGIAPLVIGLTIVSFGTSAPELIVNIFASFSGNNDIAIGNILGSNIANILLILGVAAAIYPLTVKRGTVWKEIPFSLLAVLILTVMVNDVFFDGAATEILSRSEGLVLIGFFILFMYYAFGVSKTEGTDGDDFQPKEYSVAISSMMVFVGMISLFLGGKWIVDGAVAMAEGLGVSQALIGLTVVAIGTSLPELATSAIAASKKNADIAVGNVVGSNIFNILFVLGISSSIKSIEFSSALMFDVVITVAVTVLLFVFMFLGKKHLLERWQGVVMIMFYIFYIGFLVWRG